MSTVLHRSAPSHWTVITLAGSNHDAWVSHAARGFPGPNFFNKIRRRPAVPLLELLQRRLETFDPARVSARQSCGQSLAERLNRKLPVLGISSVRPTWWVMAVLVERPEPLVHALWRAGFDATQAGSLEPVCEQEAPMVKRMLKNLVFLPLDLAMPAAERERMIVLGAPLRRRAAQLERVVLIGRRPAEPLPVV